MDDRMHDPDPGATRNARGPGIGDLLSATLNNVTNLVRGEIDLARAEVSENLNRAFIALGLIVVAIILTMLSLNVLTVAVVAGLTNLGLDPAIAAIIVGGVLAVVAAVLLLKGINDLKLSSLAPTRTARNLRRDAAAIKESYNG